MSIVSDLMAKPGVIAAGEYAYRGDRFSYKGELPEEYARMVSIMCRATTMGMVMEGGILEGLCSRCGVLPVRGWVVRGPQYTVCVVANVFCFVDNRQSSINAIVALLRKALANVEMNLV
ncbi:MAG: DUF2173 family protein [Pseudomonadota bacterium]|nr:DUF2173 family protein [Pseudomonadota bacterium]